MNESAINVDADEANKLAKLAESLLVKGRLDDAEIAILSALKKSQRNGLYYGILARIYSAQDRTIAAMEAFRHALSIVPLGAQVHWRFGEFLLKIGEFWEAEVEIKRAISLYPKESAYHVTLGTLLMRQCFYEAAYSSLQRAIRLDRKNPRPRMVLAELLAIQGNYYGAEKALTKALALAPDSSQALLALSKLLEKQGKMDEALVCTKKMIEHNPNRAAIHARISKQYRKAGRLDEAIVDMAEACRLEPENHAYRVGLASLTASSAASVTTCSIKGREPVSQNDLPISALRLIAKKMFLLFRRFRKGQ